MTTTGSWVARDACDREDCTMRSYQHRHLADGRPEPAVADCEMSAVVARATTPGDDRGRERRSLVLADREAELLEAKGPCSDPECRLHFAHRGPHDVRALAAPAETEAGDREAQMAAERAAYPLRTVAAHADAGAEDRAREVDGALDGLHGLLGTVAANLRSNDERPEQVRRGAADTLDACQRDVQRMRARLAASPPAQGEGQGATEGGALYEQLAAIQHDIWSHWMRYLIGSKTFPITQEPTGRGMRTADVEHWRRQAYTPYDQLTEAEKASDREQVDRYWHLITPAPAGAQAEGPTGDDPPDLIDGLGNRWWPGGIRDGRRYYMAWGRPTFDAASALHRHQLIQPVHEVSSASRPPVGGAAESETAGGER